jgi:hypothetical protein
MSGRFDVRFEKTYGSLRQIARSPHGSSHHMTLHIAHQSQKITPESKLLAEMLRLSITHRGDRLISKLLVLRGLPLVWVTFNIQCRVLSVSITVLEDRLLRAPIYRVIRNKYIANQRTVLRPLRRDLRSPRVCFSLWCNRCGHAALAFGELGSHFACPPKAAVHRSYLKVHSPLSRPLDKRPE